MHRINLYIDRATIKYLARKEKELVEIANVLNVPPLKAAATFKKLLLDIERNQKEIEELKLKLGIK